MRRKDQIKQQMDRLMAAHHDWAADTSHKGVTQEFADVVDDTLALFATGDIPGDFRMLFEKADIVAGLWADWHAEVEDTGDAQILPSREFDAAMDKWYDARKASEKAGWYAMTPIEQLEREGVNDDQICKHYGWYTEAMQPDKKKLAAERKKPGTHTGKNLVHPQQRRMDAMEEKRVEARGDFRQLLVAKHTASESTVAATVLELVAQQVSGRQISKMKKISIEQVMQECDEAGVDRPDVDYADVRTVRAPSEPEIAEGTSRAMDAERKNPTRPSSRDSDRPTVTDSPADESEKDKVIPLEERVLDLASGGKTAAEIVASLEPDKVSEVRVSAIIKQFGGK